MGDPKPPKPGDNSNEPFSPIVSPEVGELLKKRLGPRTIEGPVAAEIAGGSRGVSNEGGKPEKKPSPKKTEKLSEEERLRRQRLGASRVRETAIAQKAGARKDEFGRWVFEGDSEAILDRARQEDQERQKEKGLVSPVPVEEAKKQEVVKEFEVRIDPAIDKFHSDNPALWNDLFRVLKENHLLYRQGKISPKSMNEKVGLPERRVRNFLISNRKKPGEANRLLQAIEEHLKGLVVKEIEGEDIQTRIEERTPQTSVVREEITPADPDARPSKDVKKVDPRVDWENFEMPPGGEDMVNAVNEVWEEVARTKKEISRAEIRKKLEDKGLRIRFGYVRDLMKHREFLRDLPFEFNDDRSGSWLLMDLPDGHTAALPVDESMFTGSSLSVLKGIVANGMFNGWTKSPERPRFEKAYAPAVLDRAGLVVHTGYFTLEGIEQDVPIPHIPSRTVPIPSRIEPAPQRGDEKTSVSPVETVHSPVASVAETSSSERVTLPDFETILNAPPGSRIVVVYDSGEEIVDKKQDGLWYLQGDTRGLQDADMRRAFDAASESVNARDSRIEKFSLILPSAPAESKPEAETSPVVLAETRPEVEPSSITPPAAGVETEAPVVPESAAEFSEQEQKIVAAMLNPAYKFREALREKYPPFGSGYRFTLEQYSRKLSDETEGWLRATFDNHPQIGAMPDERREEMIEEIMGRITIADIVENIREKKKEI